jgi:hypothetical protein
VHRTQARPECTPLPRSLRAHATVSYPLLFVWFTASCALWLLVEVTIRFNLGESPAVEAVIVVAMAFGSSYWAGGALFLLRQATVVAFTVSAC